MNDIEKSFEEFVEKPEAVAADGWSVTDQKSAEWAAKQIAKRKARIAELTAYADAKIALVKEWLAKETDPLNGDINYFTEKLRPYAEAEVAKLKKKKSFALSNGVSLKFTNATPSFDYDDAELLKFLQEGGYNDFVEVKPKIKWGDFKSSCTVTEAGLVTAAGELVSVVKITPAGDDKFTVDVKGYKEV